MRIFLSFVSRCREEDYIWQTRHLSTFTFFSLRPPRCIVDTPAIVAKHSTLVAANLFEISWKFLFSRDPFPRYFPQFFCLAILIFSQRSSLPDALQPCPSLAIILHHPSAILMAVIFRSRVRMHYSILLSNMRRDFSTWHNKLLSIRRQNAFPLRFLLHLYVCAESIPLSLPSILFLDVFHAFPC